MQSAWPSIERSIPAGHEEQVAEMRAALESGNESLIARASWPILMVAAEAEIATALLSKGVRDSLLERLHQFDAAWHRLRP